MFDDYTNLLYARPTFLSGVARVLDLGGTLNSYNRSVSPEVADRLALASDWFAVGQDLRRAISGTINPEEAGLRDVQSGRSSR